jgi:hypothetical protein
VGPADGLLLVLVLLGAVAPLLLLVALPALLVTLSCFCNSSPANTSRSTLLPLVLLAALLLMPLLAARLDSALLPAVM